MTKLFLVLFDTVSLLAKMATYTLAELKLMNGQNEPQDNIFKARLEEYKQLLQSNLDLHTGRRHLLLIAGIITAAMFTAGFQFKRPEVFLFSSFLLILFWCKDMRMRDTIIKRRAYLEVKIEKHVDGLQWETLHSKEQRLSNRLKSLGLTVIRIYNPLIIVNLISAYLGPLGQLPTCHPIYAIAWAIITAIYGLTLLYAVKRERLKRKWVNRWEGVEVPETR